MVEEAALGCLGKIEGHAVVVYGGAPLPHGGMDRVEKCKGIMTGGIDIRVIGGG